MLYGKMARSNWVISHTHCIIVLRTMQEPKNLSHVSGIPSTQLYPIHHLDDKEFFPGDLVVDQKEESRVYGVVQSVDHQGRTAKIKWFKTYTSSQTPQYVILLALLHLPIRKLLLFSPLAYVSVLQTNIFGRARSQCVRSQGPSRLSISTRYPRH